MKACDINTFSVCVVGFTGTGKTTYINGLLRKYGGLFTPVIFDINSEQLYANYATDKSGDVDKFIKKAETCKESLIVFEEATIFFKYPADAKKVVRMLIQKRHNKNIIVYVFHSLRAVPVDILDYINYLVLFHTQDRETLIQAKYKDDDDIISLYNEVNTNANPYFSKMLILKEPLN